MKVVKWIRATLVLNTVLLIFNMIGWPYLVRFEIAYMNYIAYGLLHLFFSLSLLLSCFFIRNRELRIAGSITSSILVVPSLFLGIFALVLEAPDVVKRGDLSKILISQVDTTKGVFRLYRTDCGATCSYGAVLYKEIDAPLGIRFVQPVWSKSPESEAKLEQSLNLIKVMSNGTTLYELRI